jgi:hypothetical protein
VKRAALLFVSVAVAACSSSSETPSNTTTDTGVDPGPKTPDESCVRPGDKGNDKGVGTYCTPLGKECDAFPGAPLCLADVGQKQWMCSRIGCTTNDQCGKDATCYKDPDGSGCVPNRCLDDKDGGTDAQSDAPMSDAPSESAVDAVSDG